MKATPPPHNNNKRSITPSLFSCAFFKHCTDSSLSPPHLTSHHHILPSPSLSPPPPPPSPPPPPPPPPPPSHHHNRTPNPCGSESSSSSSFTQWRFPPSTPPPQHGGSSSFHFSDLIELFHLAELRFTSGSDSDRSSALHLLEQSLVPNPPFHAVVVPTAVVEGVVQLMTWPVLSRPATKVLLALCLPEGNRRIAVECGAPSRVVDALPDLDGAVAERALAALELMITVPEGAAQVRSHALAVPMLVATMGRMEGRGREYTLSILAAVYGGCEEDHHLWEAAPPEEVARAVVLAMQHGGCSARGKRKGAHLLKVLQQNGKVDLTQ